MKTDAYSWGKIRHFLNRIHIYFMCAFGARWKMNLSFTWASKLQQLWATDTREIAAEFSSWIFICLLHIFSFVCCTIHLHAPSTCLIDCCCQLDAVFLWVHPRKVFRCEHCFKIRNAHHIFYTMSIDAFRSLDSLWVHSIEKLSRAKLLSFVRVLNHLKALHKRVL